MGQTSHPTKETHFVISDHILSVTTESLSPQGGLGTKQSEGEFLFLIIEVDALV